MIRIPAPPEEVEQLNLLTDHLIPYATSSTGFREKILGASLPGSPASSMKALGFKRGDDGAGLRAWAAECNLMSLATLLQAEQILNFAPQGVARGAFEADGWALWALGPGSTPKERAGRWLTDRLHTAESYRRFRAADAHRLASVDEISKQANRLRLKVIEEQKKGGGRKRVVAFESRRPSTSDLLAQLIPEIGKKSEIEIGRLLYHYLSSYSHGELWAVLSGAKKIGPASPGVAHTLLPMRMDTLLLVIRAVLQLHDHMLAAYATFEGIDPTERPDVTFLMPKAGSLFGGQPI